MFGCLGYLTVHAEAIDHDLFERTLWLRLSNTPKNHIQRTSANVLYSIPRQDTYEKMQQ